MKHDTARGGHSLLSLALAILAIALLWWFAEPLAGGVGTLLDRTDTPRKADVVVVLAGGWTGERVLAGGALVRQGYAPVALLSDPGLFYEASECELARAFAAKKGFEARLFECLPAAGAKSTREEVAAIVPQLRARGVRSCLLVSVKTHMRRAYSLLHAAAPDLEIHPFGAESPQFELRRWYRRREGWKAVSLEWVKVITSVVGI
jgi:uncharacterized SAM-binding protein YcdF (DUF218 family)